MGHKDKKDVLEELNTVLSNFSIYYYCLPAVLIVVLYFLNEHQFRRVFYLNKTKCCRKKESFRKLDLKSYEDDHSSLLIEN
jgi:hypothetical protein